MVLEKVFDHDGFEVVQKKQYGRNHSLARHAQMSSLIEPAPKNIVRKYKPATFLPMAAISKLECLDSLAAQLKQLSLLLSTTQLYKELSLLVRSLFFGSAESPGCDIVCYGLGKLSSEITKLQFSLLLCLMTEFCQKSSSCVNEIYCYDPIFDSTDIELIHHFGMHVFSENDMGNRKCREGHQTIFYMPHCESFLYQNVVQTNRLCLDKIAVLGNSFSQYCLKTSDSKLKLELPFVYFLVKSGKIKESMLLSLHSGKKSKAFSQPALSRLQDAFTDMAWMVFESDILQLPEGSNEL
eukprot:Sdes_comp13686_c0_seq1m3270